MNIKFITTLTSLLGILIGYVVSNPLMFGMCRRTYTTEDYTGCLDKSAGSIGEPIFIFSISIFSISIALLAFAQKTFTTWLKFLLWWIPISVFFIATTPTTTGGWGPAILEYTKEDITFVLAALLIAISASIIFAQIVVQRLKNLKGYLRAIVYLLLWWVPLTGLVVLIQYVPMVYRPPLAWFQNTSELLGLMGVALVASFVISSVVYFITSRRK